MMTTQAPSLNFVTAMMMSTIPERQDPGRPVDDGPALPLPAPVVRWYLTMPAPAMVKPVKTPMA
jgi:hypothetical protein